MRLEITLQQGCIAEDQRLSHTTFHGGDFIQQDAAAMRDLCCLVNRFAALLGQFINR
ncbi:hypothetical protein ACFDAU_04645 [Sulfuriferula sp. GW1]|uniref:hypothetical protein n=1 Tax=Sulfuriferula sp. GW1 TaxID=3345111 RepID=UPI0039B11667